MSKIMQVHKLFRRFQQPQLQDTVKALEVRAEFDGIKYSEAANHITADVFKIPEYKLSQKVLGIQSSGGNSGGNSGSGGQRKGGRKSGSIYNSQGKVHTGYYQNWEGVSE